MTPTELLLPDLAAWDLFVAANREAICAEYGSPTRALQYATEGGLELGGGAAPLVIVYFGDGGEAL